MGWVTCDTQQATMLRNDPVKFGLTDLGRTVESAITHATCLGRGVLTWWVWLIRS
jgi:hypothetical protein